MIIVAVAPPRGVNLSGRNTHRTQNRYRKGGFFTAAAQSAAVSSQGIDGSVIGTLIGHVSGTPTVHSHGSIQRRHVLNILQKLPAEKGSAIHEFFIVNPGIKDVMQEHIFRNVPAKGTVFPEKKSVVHVGKQRFIGAPGHVKTGQSSQCQFQQPFPGSGQLIQLRLPAFSHLI